MSEDTPEDALDRMVLSGTLRSAYNHADLMFLMNAAKSRDCCRLVYSSDTKTARLDYEKPQGLRIISSQVELSSDE